MLQSHHTKAPKRKGKAKSRAFFVFWDMDDTCINIYNDTIKNPHLLLPIKLCQSLLDSHFFGICTNRSPEEKEGCYPVAQYIDDLARYGIVLNSEYVVYGGGRNNVAPQEDYHSLRNAIDVLKQQMHSVSHTQTGADLIEGFANMRLDPGEDLKKKAGHPLDAIHEKIISVKYRGKNYHLNTFIRKYLTEDEQAFTFGEDFIKLRDMTFGIVDDIEEIVRDDVIGPLGHDNYFGVKASIGGKPPKSEDTRGDYYKDDYLLEVAGRVGIHDLACKYLESKDMVLDPMLAVGLCLYAWHAEPDRCDSSLLFNHFKRLNDIQAQQIVEMLHAIHKQSVRHKDSHFREVDELIPFAEQVADYKFLESVPRRLKEISTLMELELANGLKRISVSRSSPDLQELEAEDEPKKKGSFFSKISFRKSSTSKRGSVSADSSPPEPKSSKFDELHAQQHKIMMRVETLKHSKHEEVAQLAAVVDKKLNTPKSKASSASAIRLTGRSRSNVVTSRSSLGSEDSPKSPYNRKNK